MGSSIAFRRIAPVESFAADAPAKVNLFLDVLGVRPDGYHEIDTVMQTVSLVDSLEFRRRPGSKVTLTIAGRTDGVPTDDRNLVMKAARLIGDRFIALQDSAVSEPLGADILLEKRIPPGAGLGGASSDAASALIGLSRIWGIGWAADELHALAAELGSDVPFFLRGGTARCTGRGEKVQWLGADGEMHVVLVFGPPLNTTDMYGLWDSLDLTNLHGDGILPSEIGSDLDLGDLARSPVWNSLQEAAFKALPRLRDVERYLLEAGALVAAVSGSGSCSYGISRSRDHALSIAVELRARGLDAVAARSLGPKDLPWARLA